MRRFALTAALTGLLAGCELASDAPLEIDGVRLGITVAKLNNTIPFGICQLTDDPLWGTERGMRFCDISRPGEYWSFRFSPDGHLYEVRCKKGLRA